MLLPVEFCSWFAVLACDCFSSIAPLLCIYRLTRRCLSSFSLSASPSAFGFVLAPCGALTHGSPLCGTWGTPPPHSASPIICVSLMPPADFSFGRPILPATHALSLRIAVTPSETLVVSNARPIGRGGTPTRPQFQLALWFSPALPQPLPVAHQGQVTGPPPRGCRRRYPRDRSVCDALCTSPCVRPRPAGAVSGRHCIF